jgi:WW domain-containing oxidoreductase
VTKPARFGRRATADHVLAGIDLTGKRMLVTGCSSGIGFETMNAFAANGATVIGLAKTIDTASRACSQAGPACIPMACDLANWDSIAGAIRSIHGLSVPFDAVVANAAVAHLPSLSTRYGLEMQFLTNHVGHFMLVNGLIDLVRDGSGRIVIVSSAAGIDSAPREGIMFDNLDGSRFYEAAAFYAQSKLANALYAKELSRRLANRGIAVNSVDPGAARTPLNKGFFARLLARTPAQAAATQALLAASPQAAGVSGEYWSNCRASQGSALLEDSMLARRLWDVTQAALDRRQPPSSDSLQHAA